MRKRKTALGITGKCGNIKMNIPTREECLELLKENKVPEEIQNHCKTVNKIAVFLAKKLKEKGVDINVELVDAASLLHDVGKREGEPAKGHSERGYELLKDKYPEIAQIIMVHAFFRIDQAKTWEEKIVNYADKRGHEKKVMTLKERMEDWQERLNMTIEEKFKKAEYEIEKQIFGIIGIEPDTLGEYIETSNMS
ncbi:HD domain-containing protein [Candidatus Woesearchaeota archaeon]|nr:HD domain-containing protein [Candidatus Woesearchaeota archaeon]